MSIEAGMLYEARATGWHARGRPVVPLSVDRAALVLGTYIPVEGVTAGLLPGWTPSMLTPVFPTSSAGTIKISTPGPHRNMLFWGQVLMQSTTPPVFENCAFAGRDPRDLTSTSSTVKAYGSGFYQWQAEDCLFDPGLWRDPALFGAGRGDGKTPMLDFMQWSELVARFVNTVHGGRCTIQRSILQNGSDILHSTQSMLSADDPAFTLVEGSIVRRAAYYNAADAVSKGLRTDGNHADLLQFNAGRRFTFRGNLFGGVRDTTGYDIYNATTNPTGVSYNSGDDAFTSGVMLKQQVSTDDLRRLRDILFEKNFFQGGQYCINHPQSSTLPNDFENTIIRDNYFVRRDDGRYVIRNSAFSSCYSNNRVIDLDGSGGFTVAEPITIANG